MHCTALCTASYHGPLRISSSTSSSSIVSQQSNAATTLRYHGKWDRGARCADAVVDHTKFKSSRGYSRALIQHIHEQQFNIDIIHKSKSYLFISRSRFLSAHTRTEYYYYYCIFCNRVCTVCTVHALCSDRDSNCMSLFCFDLAHIILSFASVV